MAITEARRQWCYEDLLDLPNDGRRYEIIDGELFEMPAPSWEHQQAIINLLMLIGPLVRGIGGRIAIAPLDVFGAGGNPVQPDILVLLPRSVPAAVSRGVEGAPDLVIEILSPSNPEHDRSRKRALYARGGVPEYWLVDPIARTIDLLVLDGPDYRLHARLAGDDLLASPLLPALSFPTSAAFA